jgi:hypothetical protein
MDRSTGGANTSFLSVDTGSDQVCVAGQVQGTDRSASVAFSYESLGGISKATDKTVRGEFVSVSLTLDISGGVVPPDPPYSETTTLDCRVIKASLLKEGSRDKVKLRCDLGQNYSAFPGLNSQFITNIDRAFAKQKRVKANSKNGRLSISHAGEPTDQEPPATCNVSSNGD